MPPHFYKARCRLGLLNIPFGSHEFNRGVEEGPDAILSPQFLASLGNPSTDSFDFSNPDKIDKKKYQEIIAKEYSEFATLINQSIKPEETQVVIGGDHSVTFSSFLALSQRVDPKDMAYIQFDSHADIHSFATSPSGNFHGMYVRAFVDDVESEPVQNLVNRKLPPQNMLYIGNHVNEPEEWEYLHKNNIRIISRQDLLKNTEKIHNEIKSFALSKKHLHISFDVDVFDKSLTPATGILVDNGYFPEDVLPILKILSAAPSLSMDLVEVNPQKPGAAPTIALARTLIEAVLQ